MVDEAEVRAEIREALSEVKDELSGLRRAAESRLQDGHRQDLQIARISGDVERALALLERLDKAVLGNGTPGLMVRVRALETQIEALDTDQHEHRGRAWELGMLIVSALVGAGATLLTQAIHLGH